MASFKGLKKERKLGERRETVNLSSTLPKAPFSLPGVTCFHADGRHLHRHPTDSVHFGAAGGPCGPLFWRQRSYTAAAGRVAGCPSTRPSPPARPSPSAGRQGSLRPPREAAWGRRCCGRRGEGRRPGSGWKLSLPLLGPRQLQKRLTPRRTAQKAAFPGSALATGTSRPVRRQVSPRRKGWQDPAPAALKHEETSRGGGGPRAPHPPARSPPHGRRPPRAARDSNSRQRPRAPPAPAQGPPGGAGPGPAGRGRGSRGRVAAGAGLSPR